MAGKYCTFASGWMSVKTTGQYISLWQNSLITTGLMRPHANPLSSFWWGTTHALIGLIVHLQNPKWHYANMPSTWLVRYTSNFARFWLIADLLALVLAAEELSWQVPTTTPTSPNLSTTERIPQTYGSQSHGVAQCQWVATVDRLMGCQQPEYSSARLFSFTAASIDA